MNEEIKWQDLWNLRRYFKMQKVPKHKREKGIYLFLKKIGKDYHILIEYCEEVLSLLNKTEYDFKIILTFTERNTYKNYKEQDILKFHIQDHLQRIQMQCNDSIVIIIYDSIDDRRKKYLKKIHKDIIEVGDFIKNYNAIYESLLFDDSYDNKLLQMTDFIAGCFAGTLTSIKKQDKNNYQKAVEFFCKYIYPKLRENDKVEKWGFGIIEIPKSNRIRDFYKEKVNQLISEKTGNEIDEDFPF